MKTTLKTLLTVVAMGAALAAQAGEVDTYCQLAEAQASVKSELLGSAEVFGNLGDPVSGAQSVTIGVRKSLSRSRQADTIKQIGVAECAAYRADKKLEEQVASVEARSELEALIVLKPMLEAALKAAEANIEREQVLLASQNSRLSDLKAAFEQADAIRSELADAEKRRSRVQNQLPEVDVPMSELLDASIAAQADVADLSSKVQVQGAWDVSVAAGARTDLKTHKYEGFVAVTASLSLGRNQAAQSAGRIADLTSALLNEQRAGGVQSFIRAKDAAQGVLAGEKLVINRLTQRKALLADSASRVAGVDTTDGLRMQRTIKIEALVVEALAASSQARAQYLTNWLARNS